MRKFIRSTALFVALALVSIMTVFATSSTPAHADTATGWINNHWLKAYSGGGCAYWTSKNPASPLYSGVCGHTFENVTYRIITRTSGQEVIQIADPLAGVDLTYSLGTWKWETANSSTHVFPLDQGPDGYYLMFQGLNPIHFMGPNGNGDPLKDITGSADEQQAGWELWNCMSAC